MPPPDDAAPGFYPITGLNLNLTVPRQVEIHPGAETNQAQPLPPGQRVQRVLIEFGAELGEGFQIAEL